MNRTQHITIDWLLQSGLVGDELVLEGLLRRGFLAYRDDQGVWLGTGSHTEDLDVLNLVTGLKVEPVSGHKDRMARVNMRSTRVRAMDVAIRIVAIPENHSFMSERISSCRGRAGYEWVGYRNMVWGSKIPTCPTGYIKRGLNNRLGYDALDLGVALLVKAFPLARIATTFPSCDGHGSSTAAISFASEWEPHWGKTVFNILGVVTPYSTWTWRSGVTIAPHGEFSDAEVLGMLNDIQHFARRLLEESTIDKIGRARVRTLDAFGESPPSIECFAEEARRQLALEFA
jgi:hypothetical protein